MQVIVISNPVDIPGEHELLNRLFEEGLECFHLRKPDYQKDQLHGYLLKIPSKYYNRIVLHSNYELIGKYNFRGIHLTGTIINTTAPDQLKALVQESKKRKFQLSTSMHSIEEIEKNKVKFNYVFLSPVFDSISKKGYKSNFSIEEISQYLRMKKKKFKIFALGGINENRVPEVIDSGFNGLALLGAIWEEFSENGDIEKAAEKFKNIKNYLLKKELAE